MKKIISLLVIITFLTVSASASYAGTREWATAGKILAGVLGGLLIFKGISEASKTEQTTSREVVYTEPVPSGHYETRSRVVEDNVWVPAHYETRSRVVEDNVWVPGHYVTKNRVVQERVWMPGY